VNDFMTAQMEATMSTIPLNPKDTAVLFVETQDAWLPMSRTVEPARLRAAWIWLVKLARLFELPIVLSTASLEGPTARVTPELEKAIGKLDHLMAGRPTTNAFTHGPTAKEIAGLQRKTLLVAGLLTEMAVQHSALSGVEHGYDVQVVVDACGGLSARTEDAAIRRLIQAGATVTSCASVAGQLMGDLSQGPRGMEVLKIMFEIAGSQPVAVTGESPGRA
jgi:hypothetical protein